MKKSEVRSQKAEVKPGHIARCLALLLFSFLILHPSSFALATPTLEQVFKSTNEQFDQPTNPGKFLAVGCAVAGVVVIFVVLNYRRQREVKPKALNHAGKLLKELQRELHLRTPEVRQLRTLAETQDLESPMTLLLCPSLLVKAAKERPEKVDRRVLGNMLKRLAQ